MQTRILAFALDAALIIGFAALGRSSHHEGSAIGGTLVVAWPFLAGWALGAIAAGLWRDPLDLRRAVRAWGVFLVTAMVLRTIELERLPKLPFVIVAVLFTAATLLGWRMLAAVVRRRRAGR